MTAYAEVIGDPIAQSKSPLIHGFWLGQLGIAAEYRRAHVKPEELAGYFESRRADPDWRGCNITLPHKQAALEFVEDRGGIRQSIGAINTVVRAEDGALIGTNTDAGGFYAPIAGLDLEGRHAVVIGAGGAARAIVQAVRDRGFSEVHIVNRTLARAQELADRFGPRIFAHPQTALAEVMGGAHLFVNTTSLGMDGEQAVEIDFSPLASGAVVTDIVYVPLVTPILQQARQHGFATVDGLGMLLHQAVPGFEKWFGKRPAVDESLRKLVIADMEAHQ